jgi:hypothetical protein
MKDAGAEDQRQYEIAKAEQEGFPNPHLLVLAVKQAKVEGQKNKDEKVEAEPHPEGIHKFISNLEFLFDQSVA